MTTLFMKRTTCACLAVACLLMGAMVYVLFRPTSLLMFHWADSLGLMASIHALRTCSRSVVRFLPDWFVYSLPFALWISSYLFCIRAIWWRSRCRSRYLWLWCVPLISVTAELCQHLRILPGTFDFLDLLTIGFATASVFSIPTFNQLTARGER
jgi:hypothetical protein